MVIVGILFVVFYVLPAAFLLWQAVKNDCQDATAYSGAIAPILNLFMLYGVIRYMLNNKK